MKHTKRIALKSLAAVAAAAVTATSVCCFPVFAEDNIDESANNRAVLEYIDHYVVEEIWVSAPALYNFAPVSDRLFSDAEEKRIYNVILEEIKKIANGTRTSTQITVPCSLPANVDANALSDRIMNSLLNDCPYELYWFDKTSGMGMSGNTSEITFSFVVSSDYGSGYAVDPSKTTAVSSAVTTINEIIAKYAGKSDYEKLVGYKEEICALTSYNQDAANNNSTPYGNPWQLIWVFDNNASTNVVCEGYSKAFKYLCDMTTFDAPVYCYTVSGKMDNGNHMWNIVEIDGKYYHVDITNCDEGSVGAPEKLFLKGVTSPTANGFSINGISYVYDADSKSMYSTETAGLSTTDYTYVPKTLDSIEVSADSAHKKVYTIGESFDPAGLKITLNYSDSSTADVLYADASAEFSFDTSVFSEAGEKSVTVTYKGKTAVITGITVNKKTPAASDFTFTGPADLTADGTAKQASVISSLQGMGTVTVKYEKGGKIVASPVEAGTYKVIIDVAEGTVYSAASDITAPDWTFTLTEEELPEETPEDKPEELPEETPEDKPEELPEETPEDKPEELPEETPEDKPEELPEEVPEVKPAPIYQISAPSRVYIDKLSAKAGDRINVKAPFGYDMVITDEKGQRVAVISESGSFVMPASKISIRLVQNDSVAIMSTAWNKAYVYSYDSDMNRIKISSDRKRGIVVIDLGEEYAGESFTIYSGRKNTSNEIISGTLDKNGRYKFSSEDGKNYTLVIG